MPRSDAARAEADGEPSSKKGAAVAGRGVIARTGKRRRESTEGNSGCERRRNGRKGSAVGFPAGAKTQRMHAWAIPLRNARQRSAAGSEGRCAAAKGGEKGGRRIPVESRPERSGSARRKRGPEAGPAAVGRGEIRAGSGPRVCYRAMHFFQAAERMPSRMVQGLGGQPGT